MNFKETDVLLAMKNDKDAFSRLYESIYIDLYKMAFYIIGNKEFAEDAVSETVIDAYKGISALKDSSNFENWILKILTRKCKQSLRIKYNKISVFNSNVKNIDNLEPSSKLVISNPEDKTDIQQALKKVSPEDRVIISLCIIEGYKSNEVAEILSMKATTVRSRLNRSLAKIKKYLEVK